MLKFRLGNSLIWDFPNKGWKLFPQKWLCTSGNLFFFLVSSVLAISAKHSCMLYKGMLAAKPHHVFFVSHNHDLIRINCFFSFHMELQCLKHFANIEQEHPQGHEISLTFCKGILKVSRLLAAFCRISLVVSDHVILQNWLWWLSSHRQAAVSILQP